ncbi:hypothetical protein NST69_23140 [Paenibacillus sp. FSL P2-0089]|uniref:hypothetical protein n=1 Tax=unclassified Paenibacillus TaxID=185978 RepID=UPI0030F6114B
MRFNSKKLLLFSMIILILVFPNMVFAKDNSVKLTEEKISSAVNEIVKNAGSFTEPLIVDSGLVDTEDNTKIYFYILPVDSKAVKSSNDFSIQSVTPLSSHTIPQGVKMIYSRSDGQPWTVATTTLVSMSFSTNQTSPTTMQYGHFNTDNGQTIQSFTDTSNYAYAHYAGATHIRFFITNLSAGSVIVSGQISF